MNGKDPYVHNSSVGSVDSNKFRHERLHQGNNVSEMLIRLYDVHNEIRIFVSLAPNRPS